MVANRETKTDILVVDELRVASIRDAENTGSTALTINVPLSFNPGKTITFAAADTSAAAEIIAGTTNGLQIGTNTAQKIAFWDATPVVQQVLATGAGKTVDNVITFLQTLGLCKQA